MFQRMMEYVRKFRERSWHPLVDGLRAGGMSLDNASSFRALGTKPICVRLPTGGSRPSATASCVVM